jgi:hypothetical protein
MLTRAPRSTVTTLATHAIGAKVVEALLSSLSKDDAQSLRQELYGRELRCVAGALSSSLSSSRPQRC